MNPELVVNWAAGRSLPQPASRLFTGQGDDNDYLGVTLFKGGGGIVARPAEYAQARSMVTISAEILIPIATLS